MKKHILALALALSLLAAPGAAAELTEAPAPAETETAAPAADAAVEVTVNGVPVQWTDVTPFIDGNDRTMVPLRAVAEALGLNVMWREDRREAVFYHFDTLAFPIGGSYAYNPYGVVVPMDTAAVIVSDRTFAPVRYLAEYFGFTVDWDGETRTVLITGEEEPILRHAIEMAAENNHYEHGETIAIRYSGVPRVFLDDGAVIGMMGPWTDSGQTVLAAQPVAAEGTLYFTAPNTDGFVTFRFFRTGEADDLHVLEGVTASAAVGFVPGGQG